MIKRKKRASVKESVQKPEFINTIFMPFVYGFFAALIIFMAVSRLVSFIRVMPKANKPVKIAIKKASKEDLKKALETAISIYMDPMELTGLMDDKLARIIILDTRSSQDYNLGHVRGAVMAKDEVAGNLKGLKGKTVIIYGQTASDPAPKEMALYLIGKGVESKILSVGWNEFRHFRNLWVPERLWGKFDPGKYIQD